jgi:hypothetical protein
VNRLSRNVLTVAVIAILVGAAGAAVYKLDTAAQAGPASPAVRANAAGTTVQCAANDKCAKGHVGQPCIASSGFHGTILTDPAGHLYCAVSPNADRPRVIVCAAYPAFSCTHGQVGQRCKVVSNADGSVVFGIIVAATPGNLICDTNGPVTPPPAATPTVNSTCAPGFLANGRFYPDTRPGYRAAYAAASGYPHYGDRITISDSGQGITLSGFIFAVYDSQGTQIVSHTIDGGYGMPLYLAPGESQVFVIDANSLSNTVYMSFRDFLATTCSVTQWYHP